MTKEDLIEKCFHICDNKKISSDAEYLASTMRKFFKSNVCIPKGETLQMLFSGKWIDKVTINNQCEYRIKPSEPIYEWQWETEIGGIKTVFDYMTEEEALAFEHRTSFYGIRHIKETKRVRQ